MTAASGRPLIAVPAMWSSKASGLRFSASVVAAAVLEAIDRAGGEAACCFPGATAIDLTRYDGVVLPGGSDIDPARYGQTPHPAYAGTDFPQQDDADARAIAAVEAAGLPALFICRGMQLWNVERGGTMHQDWPAVGGAEHVGTVHDVDVEPDSRLAAAVGGTRIDVSSYHHQAVDEVGRGLRVVARSEDGCVEALEDPALDIVAVQWHPEDRAADVTVDQRLFDWVVERARIRSAERHGAPADPAPVR